MVPHSNRPPLLAVLTALTLLGLATILPVRTAAGQPAGACPAPEALDGVEVCVDRGEGAIYLEGESIRICVTVSIPTILIFPPPPPPLVRLTNTVDGIAPRVLFEEAFSSGQRCLDATITPPLGEEVILAEVLSPDGWVIATDAVTYRSTAANRVMDEASLVAALQVAGATVERGEPVFQPFFDVEGRILRVNGADVQVFEYPDEAAAALDAARIAPDGSGLGPPTPTLVTWVAAPHWYRSGRLIVLYVGEDRAILDLLARVLGPPFADR